MFYYLGLVSSSNPPVLGSGNLVNGVETLKKGNMVFIYAGVAVGVFFLVVAVSSIVYFVTRRNSKRRRRKSSSSATVHFQSDSHDNPTYMAHVDIVNLPTPTPHTGSTSSGGAGATGVSFDSIPPKGQGDDKGGDGDLPDRFLTSDKAQLIKQDVENQKAADLQQVVLNVSDSSTNVVYNNVSS